MGKYIRGVLFLGLTVIALGGGRAGATEATGKDDKDEESPPKITLRVYNYARVPTPILVSTEPGATRILRRAGLVYRFIKT